MTVKSSGAGRWVAPHDPTQASHNLAEWLLVHTLDDMEARTQPGQSRYGILGLAPLLRRALLDESPIVHLARSRLKLHAPRFECTPFVQSPPEPPVEGGRWLTVLRLSGESFSEPTIKFGVEKFLAAPIGQLRRDDVTVLQLIRYFAHVHGGVHIGKPESALESLMQSIASASDEVAESWMEALRSIAVVTIRALRPLQARIEADRPDLRD